MICGRRPCCRRSNNGRSLPSPNEDRSRQPTGVVFVRRLSKRSAHTAPFNIWRHLTPESTHNGARRTFNVGFPLTAVAGRRPWRGELWWAAAQQGRFGSGRFAAPEPPLLRQYRRGPFISGSAAAGPRGYFAARVHHELLALRPNASRTPAAEKIDTAKVRRNDLL